MKLVTKRMRTSWGCVLAPPMREMAVGRSRNGPHSYSPLGRDEESVEIMEITEHVLNIDTDNRPVSSEVQDRSSIFLGFRILWCKLKNLYLDCNDAQRGLVFNSIWFKIVVVFGSWRWWYSSRMRYAAASKEANVTSMCGWVLQDLEANVEDEQRSFSLTGEVHHLASETYWITRFTLTLLRYLG